MRYDEMITAIPNMSKVSLLSIVREMPMEFEARSMPLNAACLRELIKRYAEAPE